MVAQLLCPGAKVTSWKEAKDARVCELSPRCKRRLPRATNSLVSPLYVSVVMTFTMTMWTFTNAKQGFSIGIEIVSLTLPW